MIDPQDGAQSVSNDAAASDTAQNTPPATTPAPEAQQPSTATPATVTPAQTQPQQTQAPQPTQPAQPQNGVSNTPAAPVHPAIQRASLLHNVAAALAGGDRFQTTINPQTGATTRTAVPLTRGQIGMAIALEAISGSLSGLAQTGPGAIGKAGVAGLQQGQQIAQQRQQAQQQQDQQAQDDAKSQQQALVAKASAFESNNRAILNTAQSERYGVDSLKDAVTANSQLLSDYTDANAVQESHVSQDTLQADIASGKLDPTKVIGIPDGWTSLNGKYEQTFSIVADPRAKVPLSQDQYDSFAANGILGFKKGVKIPDGYSVPGTMIANANAQVQAIDLMKQDVSGVVDTLSHSSDKANQELAKSIPDIQSLLNDPNNGPTLQRALVKMQKYVSHSTWHGLDFAESLKQMAAPSKQDPRNPKNFIPNPDANAAQVIAGAFGNGDPQKGWQILSAYHDSITPTPIKDTADAESIASDPASSPRDVARAKQFLALDSQQKQASHPLAKYSHLSQDGNYGFDPQQNKWVPVSGPLNLASLTPKEYGAIIDGIGTNSLGDPSQLLRYGKADQLKILADTKARYPDFNTTQYQANLGLAKWATSGKGGDQIQALNTLHAHASDFADNVNALGNTDSSLLNTPINAIKKRTGNPNIVSTLGQLLAVRTEYMNVLNNNHALSVEDKADADTLMNENQSPHQWLAAINQITHTADLRGAETNARYRATFGKDMPNYRGSQSQGGAANVVPAGATPGRDASGRVTGYRTADGKVTRF